MDAALSLHQVAEELGVHYMTVYRYVRLGLLPAVKQAGVWQVALADLEEFRAGGARGPVEAGQDAPWAERFTARLLEGDAQGAWGVIEAALTAGTDLRRIHLEVISPAMVGIGARWAAGTIDIAVEHQATVIVQRLLGRLSPRFSRPGRSRGVVVLGAPTGESHSLPTALLSDLLRLEGWEVADLGPDSPASSFIYAAGRADPLIAVGISVTHPAHLPEAAEVCAALGDAHPGVLRVIGGAAVRDLDMARTLGADAVASSVDVFTALLDEATAGTK